jgi:predicted ester cyclase
VIATDKVLAQRIFEEIVNQKRKDVIDELLDENYVDHGRGQNVHGWEAFRSFMKMSLSAVPDVHCECRTLSRRVTHSAGWCALPAPTSDALGFPATGKQFETVSANIGVVRNGKAVEHWSEGGVLAMLQQVGVIPQMEPPQPV